MGYYESRLVWEEIIRLLSDEGVDAIKYHSTSMETLRKWCNWLDATFDEEFFISHAKGVGYVAEASMDMVVSVEVRLQNILLGIALRQDAVGFDQNLHAVAVSYSEILKRVMCKRIAIQHRAYPVDVYKHFNDEAYLDLKAENAISGKMSDWLREKTRVQKKSIIGWAEKAGPRLTNMANDWIDANKTRRSGNVWAKFE